MHRNRCTKFFVLPGKQVRQLFYRLNLLRRVPYLLFLTIGCIEPYQFVIENETPALVVEGFISDISYQETLEYPSDGRHFTIKLSYTSDVTNTGGAPATGASVILKDDAGEEWQYAENKPGEYVLCDNEFKALQGRKYKMRIQLQEGGAFESEWQGLPAAKKQPIGEISFTEVSKDMVVREAGENVIRPVKGISVLIDLPATPASEGPSGNTQPLYYRWDFSPTWVFIAPLQARNKKCWIRGISYLSDFTLHTDHVGGYKKALLFTETYNNVRFFERFSLLVRQFMMNPGYYEFWNDMKIQADASIKDIPPYNTISNIKPVNNGTDRAVGYFGVVQEQATRWYFDKSQLSYTVINTLKAGCNRPNAAPPALCTDCMAYPLGEVTLSEPSWWVEK